MFLLGRGSCRKPSLAIGTKPLSISGFSAGGGGRRTSSNFPFTTGCSESATTVEDGFGVGGGGGGGEASSGGLKMVLGLGGTYFLDLAELGIRRTGPNGL